MTDATTPIRHIVFDIGKVLIHYDPHIPFSRLIPDEAERNAFFATVCTHEWNLEQDRGRTWADAEDMLVAQFPEQEANIRAFRIHWGEMVPHAYEESVAILEALVEKGYDVTMLTNFAVDTFAEARARFAFLNLPRGVTVSGEKRQIKPDREIYETHQTTFDLDPAATLFIDDSLANVEGARAAGWQAVQFIDGPTLKADLARLGLPV
ncbi:2-haloalkanoic acid dehalogenase [Rhizobium sp. Leaf384]|uniref:HAD family hydrolase n=1 Tax=unclassified Rhizobium TaxID=2613769 RepID=UPI000714403E|nr:MULTISPECIES: HAD family phosphatase [unclassified Rhizobium]KQS77404.1 2-haloalkanoic acid dehalogenase [Rhizobium sp. Leaf383]KQS80688.1 2-haloalkanoic acid dehalogenase [Rhizobium sp. Leaf384]